MKFTQFLMKGIEVRISVLNITTNTFFVMHAPDCVGPIVNYDLMIYSGCP
jgi:hypothetical protein